MIFIGGVTIIVAIIVIILAGWLVGEYIPLHRTVLMVNDTRFDTAYYIDVMKFAARVQPDTNIQLLANNAIQQIGQDELIRQAAEKLGITVSEQDAIKILKDAGIRPSKGYIGVATSQLVHDRLNKEYFATLVPESDNQVSPLVMMLESERQALEMRDKLLNGDNFTALAKEYALNYYSQNVNSGEFGWHPAAVLKEQLGSMIPVEFAFNAAVGALSPPLRDEDMYKQVGYWLLKVLERPGEDQATVQAILVSSQQLAESLKTRLDAGDNLTAIADEYTQYSPSKEKHGELGVMQQSDNISEAFNGYVFNPGTELGKWSDPIRDGNYWTTGGDWLVKVVDKAENMKLTTDDRNFLLDKAYQDWVSRLFADPANIVDDSYLTQEIQVWAIDKVTKAMKAKG
jgi:hypothetical protein